MANGLLVPEIGLRSVAVPIRNGQRDLVAAMSLSVATSRISPDEVIEKLLQELEVTLRSFGTLL
ncbi:MAG: IclR family transcriptional regulator C-terminal domain-containing protein [Burkholderiaceae bacterium]|nr:IclR family transcriptional regulator C-terminal domain-containing protein [Burkholderiaceae bacterium]